MEILAVGAHPDDITLGCSAYLTKLQESGRYGVYATHLGVCTRTLADCSLELLPIRVLSKAIEDFCKQNNFTPDIVFTQSEKDINQDHRKVFEATRVVFRPWASKVMALLSYEIPGISTVNFAPDYFVECSEHDIERKMARFATQFEDEVRPYPNPCSEDAIMATARMRGVQSGYKYAEAFETIFFRIGEDRWTL